MTTPTSDQVKALVSRIPGLPTLPVIVQKLNDMMLNPRTTAKEVGRLISSDPALSAKILKIVNSSFYGFPSRITTVTHAIVILGFNTVKSVVLSSTVFDVFKSKGENEFKREEFWKHSVGCGAACRVIAREAGFSALEDFFIAGLMHDVGKIILDQYLHDDFQKVLATVKRDDCLFLEAEKKVLAVTHAEIGGWLFQNWKLSKGLVQAVTYHHNPSLADDALKITSVIHLGDIVCRALQCGSGGDAKIPRVSPAAWDALGFTPPKLESILRETDQEIEKAKVFLDFL